MRNALRILVLVMITASFSSCEEIKSLLDVEIETTIEGDLSFVTDETELKSTEDYGFDATITVQVLNDDIYEYDENIQNFIMLVRKTTSLEGVDIRTKSLIFDILFDNIKRCTTTGSDKIAG